MHGFRHVSLVKSRQEGNEVYYYVDDPHIVELFQQGVRHVQDE